MQQSMINARTDSIHYYAHTNTLTTHTHTHTHASTHITHWGQSHVWISGFSPKINDSLQIKFRPLYIIGDIKSDEGPILI